jgi:iron complex outermembrane recepter protein
MFHPRRNFGRFAPLAAFSGAALVSIGSVPASAQDSAAQLDEIIVTARKVEEKLNEVPVAITAFSAAELQSSNATSLADVAALTPGFSFEAYSGGTTPAPLIRGLTQNALTDRNQNVATFVDGVHVQQQGNIDFSLLDLERIEVIKGPQNAQYGKSSFAGAINWVPKRPNLESWEGSVAVTAGTDERRDIAGAISVPLWQDKLAVRLYATNTEFDGTFKNNYPNASDGVGSTIAGYTWEGVDGNLGGYDNDAIQASLRFRPIDALTMDLLYFRSETRNDPGAGITIQPLTTAIFPAATAAQLNPHNCSPNAAGINQLRCGEIPIDESRVIADPRSQGSHTHSDMLSGRIAWEFSEALTATYLYGKGLYDAAGYQAGGQPEVLIFGDLTIRPASAMGTGPGYITFSGNPFTDQESESHELRFDGQLGSVKWRVGYYHNEVDDLGALALFSRRLPLSADPTNSVVVTQIPFVTASPQSLLSQFGDKTDSGFFTFNVPFNDQWDIDVEGRYNKEERTQVSVTSAFGPTGAPTGVTTTRSLKRDFSSFTPRLNLRWRPSEDWTFYVSGAKGEKAGGFNGVTADVEAFDPETNTTIELGGKQTLWDRRLQLNYSVFWIDWKDLQLSVPDTIPVNPNSTVQEPNFIGNTKGADSQGVEIEAQMLLTDRLKGRFTAAYVQSTFKDGTVDTTFGRLCETPGAAACVFLPRTRVGTVPGPLPLGGSPIGGNDLPRTPRTQLTATLDYKMPLGNFELSLRGDLAYQSKYYAENLNLAWIPDRTLLNLNVGLGDADGVWSVNLWGKNVTDETYASSAFAVSVVNQYIPALGQGATFGLTGRYNFKGGN